MIFHENRLQAGDSHEISNFIFFKIKKEVIKFVVCCSVFLKHLIEKKEVIVEKKSANL